MKTSTVILALASAAADASFNAQEPCSTMAVRGFLVDANAKACATQTGVGWKPYRVYTPIEIAAFCKTPPCLTFLATLLLLNTGECKIPGGGYPHLYTDLLNKVALYSGSSTPPPATLTPAPVGSAPATQTPAPVATTTVPTTPTVVPTTLEPTLLTRHTCY